MSSLKAVARVAQRGLVHHVRARSDGVPNFMKGSPNNIEIGDPGSPKFYDSRSFHRLGLESQ